MMLETTTDREERVVIQNDATNTAPVYAIDSLSPERRARLASMLCRLPRPSSISDRARELADTPAPPRLSLGLDTLDRITRRGVPVGRRIVLVGAPGAGKTALSIQWADRWAREGAAVAYLAADQDPDSVLVRLAERAGIPRDDLEGVTTETARASAWRDAADRLDDIAARLAILDGSTVTIEAARDVLSRMTGDGRRVLLVDSLQTVQCTAAVGSTSKREQIDTALLVLRAIAAAGVLVVIVSEMARGAYRSNDTAANTNAISSAKESGGIEYGADLLLALRSVKGEADLVDVETAKNRLGPREDFRLRVDPRLASLVEVACEDVSDEEREAAAEAKEERRLAALETRCIEAVLKSATPLRSASAVARLVGGNKQLVLRAVARLLSAGRLADVEGQIRVVNSGLN